VTRLPVTPQRLREALILAKKQRKSRFQPEGARIAF
jgi:hypothetical protein